MKTIPNDNIEGLNITLKNDKDTDYRIDRVIVMMACFSNEQNHNRLVALAILGKADNDNQL